MKKIIKLVLHMYYRVGLQQFCSYFSYNILPSKVRWEGGRRTVLDIFLIDYKPN